MWWTTTGALGGEHAPLQMKCRVSNRLRNCSLLLGRGNLCADRLMRSALRANDSGSACKEFSSISRKRLSPKFY
eukprot:6479138-Amphidinium_carterae.4